MESEEHAAISGDERGGEEHADVRAELGVNSITGVFLFENVTPLFSPPPPTAYTKNSCELKFWVNSRSTHRLGTTVAIFDIWFWS